MAESAFSVPRGAEISERSSELVLPDDVASTASRVAPEPVRARSLRAVANETSEREIGLNEAGPTQQASSASRAGGATASDTTDPKQSVAPSERGLALPGDRKPRKQPARAQRPSFWRRIALGRRSHRPEEPAPAQSEPDASRATAAAAPGIEDEARESASTSSEEAAAGERGLSLRERLAPSRPEPIDPAVLEQRIVAPMLQALVSVEAKLERSHTDLTTRADQVEQRLTQLWDIEEQLGALGDVQESLLQVSEQQRKLESAVVTQTHTIRWLVGAVFVSLAVAAFVVAALLR